MQLCIYFDVGAAKAASVSYWIYNLQFRKARLIRSFVIRILKEDEADVIVSCCLCSMHTVSMSNSHCLFNSIARIMNLLS